MDVEELKADKLQEIKQEMYEDLQRSRSVEAAIKAYEDEIRECYEYLHNITMKIEKRYGHVLSVEDLLKGLWDDIRKKQNCTILSHSKLKDCYGSMERHIL